MLHMTRLHAKRPLLVELRVINGPFEGGCRLLRVVVAPLVGVQHILTLGGSLVERTDYGLCAVCAEFQRYSRDTIKSI